MSTKDDEELARDLAELEKAEAAKRKPPEPIKIFRPKYYASGDCRTYVPYSKEISGQDMSDVTKIEATQNILYGGTFGNAYCRLTDDCCGSITIRQDFLRKVAMALLEAAEALEEYQKRPIKVIEEK